MTSPRRSPRHLHPARAHRAVTGVAALFCFAGLGPAVSAVAAGTTATDNAPADALGSPASSTIARADDLLIGDDTSQAHTVGWETAKPDLSGLAAQGPVGTAALRPVKNPDYATTSGRLLDPQHDSVLAFRQGSANGANVWTLGASNDTAETSWDQIRATGAPLDAGNTYVLTLKGAAFTTATADISGSAGTVATAQVAPSAGLNQQWSAIEDPDRQGWFQLVDRSDGMCLDALDASTQPGSPVGTYPCGHGGGNQLWKMLPNGQITNAETGLSLTLDSASHRLVQTPGGSNVPNQTWSLGQPTQRPQVLPTWSAVTGSDPAAPFAATSGDLDRAVDDDGQYHDEAAVAYADGDHRLQVRVVDYNATGSRLLATAPTTALPVLGDTRNGHWFPGSVGIASGDFDGDGLNELAVTWQDTAGVHATFLRYTADGSNRTLTVAKPDVLLVSAKDVPALSLVSGLGDTKAGDFDGSGRDSLAVAYAKTTGKVAEADVLVARFSGSLALVAKATSGSDGTNTRITLTPDSADTTWTPRGIRLAPGLFRLDDAGYTLQRRELAIAYTPSMGPNTQAATKVQVLDVTSSDPTTMTIDAQAKSATLTLVNPQVAQQYPLSIAAGGYRGLKGDQDPQLWGIAVASSDTKSSVGTTRQSRIQVLGVNAKDLTLGWQQVYDGDHIPHVTGYDRSGSSLALGAPAVFTVTNMARTDLAAAQPPAHADWLNDGFVNVSRNPDFAVEMGTDKATTIKTSTTTTTGTVKGVSEEFKSENTVKTGVKGIAEFGGSFDVDQAFSMDWTAEKKTLEGYSRTTATDKTATGTDDDMVESAMQTVTIYRYPILNGPLKNADGQNLTTADCTQKCYGYWEVEVPGETIGVHGYGRSYDWYQPTWQNGNALSYPTLVGGKVVTPDLGSYSYKDEKDNTVVKTEPLFNVVNDVGGGTAADRMHIETTQRDGTDRTSERTMTNSVDATIGISAKVHIGAASSFKTEDSVSLGYKQTDSWSQLKTGESETSSGQDFTLNVPQVATNQSYRVGTAYYYDSSGAQRVIHGVDLTSNAQGREWWQLTYGQKSDPALNLPNATVMTQESGRFDKPAWSSSPNRQKIRGFGAVDPASQVPLTQSPLPGDKVAFQVQVHNFSLKNTTSAVPVRFYAVPIDSGTLKPAGTPEPLGPTQTINAISAQGMVTVTSPTWTAPPNSGAATQDYRIFVVLDENDSQPEIHPLHGGEPCPVDSTTGTTPPVPLVDPMTGKDETLACGQNNQGYGTITVMPNQLQATRGTARVNLTGVNLLTTSGVALGSGSSSAPSVRQGVPVLGVVQAATDGDDRDLSPVLVFDGNPRKGNLVASTTLTGATMAAGGSAPFTYIPTRVGRHHLHTLLLGGQAGHATPGPTFTVNVKPARR